MINQSEGAASGSERRWHKRISAHSMVLVLVRVGCGRAADEARAVCVRG